MKRRLAIMTLTVILAVAAIAAARSWEPLALAFQFRNAECWSLGDVKICAVRSWSGPERCRIARPGSFRLELHGPAGTRTVNVEIRAGVREAGALGAACTISPGFEGEDSNFGYGVLSRSGSYWHLNVALKGGEYQRELIVQQRRDQGPPLYLFHWVFDDPMCSSVSLREQGTARMSREPRPSDARDDGDRRVTKSLSASF